jgi:hypothetical protein
MPSLEILILLACVLGGLPGAAWAQEEERAEGAGGASGDARAARAPGPVEVLDVQFLEEIARVLPERGSWLPVYVELEARGGKTSKVLLTGEVKGRKGQETLTRFSVRREVEVAPGAPVRSWLYLHATTADFGQVATLEARSPGGELLLERRWDLSFAQAFGHHLSVLVVAAELGDVTPWPGQLMLGSRLLQPARRSSQHSLDETIESMRRERLPDNVLGYNGIDLVVLRQHGTLEEAQLEALRSWVHVGGCVVVMPERGSAAPFKSRLVRELGGKYLVSPAVEERFVPQDLAVSLRTLERRGLERPEPYAREEDIAIGGGRSYFRLDPLSGEAGEIPELREVWSLDAEAEAVAGRKRLYAEIPFGRGRLGVFTIDDQTYRDAESLAFLQALWLPVVLWRLDDETSPFLAQAATRVPADTPLRDASRDIGLPFLIGLIVVYLLLAGPGLYFILKRANRMASLVWAEPLLAAVYVGIIFATGYLSKGVITKTELWTVFSQRQGDSLAVRESYLSIFSGADEEYTIHSPRGAFLAPIFANLTEAEKADGSGLRLRSAPRGGYSLEGYRLSLWEQGYALNAAVEDLGRTGVEIGVLTPASPAARSKGSVSRRRWSTTQRC